MYDSPNLLENRFKITVEFEVVSESLDDAQDEIKMLIEQGVIGLIDKEDLHLVTSWDVIDAEPSEVQ